MDGKNFIGRADDMDIQVLGDNKIARRNHAVIVFDAKKRENMILLGDSRKDLETSGCKTIDSREI